MIPFLPILSGLWTSNAKYLIIALVVVLAFGGIYIKGRYDGAAKIEAQYAKEKAEWVAKISIEQSLFDKQANDFWNAYLLTSLPKKEVIKYIKTKPEIITQYIPVDYDRKCTLPQGFIEVQNKAAQGVALEELKEVPTNYGVPSEKKLSEVATVITENYYNCNVEIDKLDALQKVVKSFQEKQKELGIE